MAFDKSTLKKRDFKRLKIKVIQIEINYFDRWMNGDGISTANILTNHIRRNFAEVGLKRRQLCNDSNSIFLYKKKVHLVIL